MVFLASSAYPNRKGSIMFNYKAATNLVGFINALKVVAIVLALLWGAVGAVASVIAYGINAQNDGLATVGVIVALLLGVFWACVAWATFGFFQHHLAAVARTAFIAEHPEVAYAPR
jgi:hypothetical protein